VGRLDAPFLKVLQKLRYRSEHIVHVTMECYSQLDRVLPRKQDRGFGGELSGRVHGHALTWDLASTARRLHFNKSTLNADTRCVWSFCTAPRLSTQTKGMPNPLRRAANASKASTVAQRRNLGPLGAIIRA
jgi:hypothetical protein